MVTISNTLPPNQELHFVFADGHRVNAANDLAVYDYAVMSTIAGFSGAEGSPVDSDYAYVSSWQQQLETLAGTNDTRLERSAVRWEP